MEWALSEQQSQTALAMAFREVHMVSFMPTVGELIRQKEKSIAEPDL